jgi:hypothetical protein
MLYIWKAGVSLLRSGMSVMVYHEMQKVKISSACDPYYKLIICQHIPCILWIIIKGSEIESFDNPVPRRIYHKICRPRYRLDYLLYGIALSHFRKSGTYFVEIIVDIACI